MTLRIGLLFLGAISLFLVGLIRVDESLFCARRLDGLRCDRELARLLGRTSERFEIRDSASIKLRISGHNTVGHVSMNTSAIEARDITGRTVDLLTVSERNVADGSAVVRALRDLFRGDSGAYTFRRDQRSMAITMISGVALFWIALVVGLRKAAQRTTDAAHHQDE